MIALWRTVSNSQITESPMLTRHTKNLKKMSPQEQQFLEETLLRNELRRNEEELEKIDRHLTQAYSKNFELKERLERICEHKATGRIEDFSVAQVLMFQSDFEVSMSTSAMPRGPDSVVVPVSTESPIANDTKISMRERTRLVAQYRRLKDAVNAIDRSRDEQIKEVMVLAARHRAEAIAVHPKVETLKTLRALNPFETFVPESETLQERDELEVTSLFELYRNRIDEYELPMFERLVGIYKETVARAKYEAKEVDFKLRDQSEYDPVTLELFREQQWADRKEKLAYVLSKITDPDVIKRINAQLELDVHQGGVSLQIATLDREIREIQKQKRASERVQSFHGKP